MANCKPCDTPILKGMNLISTGGTLFSNLILYRSKVGTLQYLTHTRPDIAYVINMLSQFLQQPTNLHR